MPTETVRSRVVKCLRGEMPADRLPRIEWASWWDQTIRRWEGEGMPAGMSGWDIKRYFGLDLDCQFGFAQMGDGAPGRPTEHGQGWICDEADYERLLPWLYPDPVPLNRGHIREVAQWQTAGEAVMWITLCGFFWWPRVLLGIEPHLMAFYDQPELMRRINEDQARYCRRCIEAFVAEATPDYMTFAEDMSYNHGPMISRAQFDTFMAPYFHEVVPLLHEHGITVIIDSDGDIEQLVPWFESVGIDGILPLERMAGVDVARVRRSHSDWRMVGAFDKTVMHLGEDAIRAEFERLLPVMRTGGFIPSVDHQTPPGVSIEDYRLYLKLLWEYTETAVRG